MADGWSGDTLIRCRKGDSRLNLLIAIPVHNELGHVERVLGEVRRYHDEILVVDDGSQDGTSEVLQDLSRSGRLGWIRHKVNLGYGKSVIDAFRFAAVRGYDWVITMDCDEQHEPRSIPRFIDEINTERWDVISGSRYLRPNADDDLPPSSRQKINATITDLLNRKLGLELTDAFCGFKAHRVSALGGLALEEAGYAFPLQFWPRAAKAGLRITEIPVRLIYNDPNRHFGGRLDDPRRRLRHYLRVLDAEMQRRAPEPLPREAEVVSALSGCCYPD